MGLESKYYYEIFLFLIPVFLFFSGCKQQPEKTFTAKYIVDINNPADISIDEFVTDIDTIRLETTDESIMHDIVYFHIMDGKIYIFTYDRASSIYIFDIKGISCIMIKKRQKRF
jgi:hypothetical protein